MKVKGLGVLIKALIMVESGGNDNAIGDRHLAHPAYGALQIRQPVCDDYNRAHGTNYRASDMRGKAKRSVAEKICRWYVTTQAPRKFLGRAKKLEEVFARTWNGGPNGVHKSATLKYWQKVQKTLAGERRKLCGKR